MDKSKTYKFDAYRKIATMRLTPDEMREMNYAFMNLVEPDVAKEQRTDLDSIGQHLLAAEEYVENWGKIQGLSSGYQKLDEGTFGFLPGELIILGGYTSRGKTQLALNMAHRMTLAGKGVLFVSLEMTKPIITSRFVKLGGIDTETPIFFQSAEVMEPAEMDELVRKAKLDGAEFVIIDHLHYFARGDNVIGKVGEVTRSFKRLALKHEIPILLLSQLSRPDKASRVGKLDIPNLSDLKESGYIEQDADIVLMVHRFTRDDAKLDESIDPHKVFVAVRKNRNRGMEGNLVTILHHDYDGGVILSEVDLHPKPADMFPGASKK